jgi:tetratricopeptide (TPR) repeat protein
VLPAPTDERDVLCEELRVAAEAMELGGCFELAYSVVTSVCRIHASGGYVSAMLATTHLGRVARQMNDLSFAEDCYSNVVTTSMRERDGPLAARGHIGLALIHDMRGNFPACEAEYRRVLAVAAPNGSCAVGAWHGLMSIAMTRGDLADALLFGWQIYDVHDKDADARVGILTDLSIVAAQAGFPVPALNGFRQALTMANTERQIMPVLGGAVRAAAAMGDIELTAEYDRQALRSIARANQPYMATMTLLNIADAWLVLRQLDTATARVAAARDLAEKFRYAEYVFRADAIDDRIRAAARLGTASRTTTEAAQAVTTDEVTARGIRRLEALHAH